ncbi:MAG: PAS domain S-box protein [bacterium]
MGKLQYDLLISELSILYEISSISSRDTQEEIGKEVMEKAIRLFCVHYFALTSSEKVIISYGFRNPDEISTRMKQNKPNQIQFVFEGQTLLFMEQANPIGDRERQLYNIFAYRVGKELSATKNRIAAKLIEDALRESEEKYRDLVERANDGICILQDGKFVFANQHLADMLGYTVEEMINTSIAKYLHPDVRDEVLDIYKCRMAGEAVPPVYESALLHKDGSKVEVEINATSTTYHGKPADLPIVRDITSRKRAEEELQKYREQLEELVAERTADLKRYKFMVDSAHDAIFFKDLESRYIIINDKALEAFGLSRQEVIGKNDYELMPDQQEAKKNVEDDQLVFKTGKLKEITKHMTDVSGKTRWFQAIKVPQFDDKGNMMGLVGIARDITERKQMEEELKKYRDHLKELVEERTKELKETQDKLIQSERLAAAAQIATEAAHEVKNPLSVIKAGLYYLKKILPEDEEAQKNIYILNNAVERTTAYINDLLNFSRQPVLNLMSVEINELLAESLKELPEEILSGIEVSRDLDPDLPQIKADPERLKQVFTNIIKNASESMGKEVRRPVKAGAPKLEVRSWLEEGVIKIAISDTGVGIPKEDLKRIFDPFFTTKCKGTGLGLAICQRIIDAHKGEIEVKSKVGQGATFTIRLPNP